MKNSLRRKTNWDEYYQKPYKTAGYSRKITEKILINLIRKYRPLNQSLNIAELGGAGSCFFESIMIKIKPDSYSIIDNNKLGIKIFLESYSKYPIQAYERDVLKMDIGRKFNLVLSIGLIEHFSREETRTAIRSHFNILEDGGLALIFFPTPTFLYKITRFSSESLGLWIFHDERPIPMQEAREEIKKYGEIVFEKINWPIFLTQGIIAARKK